MLLFTLVTTLVAARALDAPYTPPPAPGYYAGYDYAAAQQQQNLWDIPPPPEPAWTVFLDAQR